MRSIALALLVSLSPALAQLPDAGFRVEPLCDDFEAANWSFNLTTNISSNGLWYGSPRGAPEVMTRVATPAGGPAGSVGALSLRTRYVEQIPSTANDQEDLVFQPYTSLPGLGRNLLRAEKPSYSVRVKLPPIATWAEGYTVFGFRVAARDPNHTGNSVGEYYPSLLLARSGTTAYVLARVGDGSIADQDVGRFTQANLDAGSGWMSLGLRWDDDGRTRYHAQFTALDFIAGSEVGANNAALIASARRMSETAYHFLSLAHPNTNQGSETITPDFIVDNCRVSTVRPIGTAIGADKDGDGLSNGIEYAFGLNPAAPTSPAEIPAISLNGESLATSYAVPAGVTGVTYAAESSETLASWTPVANTGSGSTRTFAVGTTGKSRLFLRHKLTFAP